MKQVATPPAIGGFFYFLASPQKNSTSTPLYQRIHEFRAPAVAAERKITSQLCMPKSLPSSHLPYGMGSSLELTRSRVLDESS